MAARLSRGVELTSLVLTRTLLARPSLMSLPHAYTCYDVSLGVYNHLGVYLFRLLDLTTKKRKDQYARILYVLSAVASVHCKIE